jgi:hypothetical protein
MSEAAARPGTAQPYADVLSNVGKPSLSAGSDMPEINLTAPGQGEGEAGGEGGEVAGIDGAKDPKDTTQTSDPKPEGEGDAPPKPKGEEGGEEGDKTSPQQRAAFARERNRRQAAENRATALETQVAKLTEAVTKLVGDKNTPKEDPRPARDTFDNPDAYDKALESWVERRATTKATADAKAEFEQQQQDGQRQALVDTYKGREAAFQADHPDFEDTVYADDVKITPAMTQAILEAEDGPAIAYHLGQNPEVAERIAGLSPAQQVTELGRISVKLATPPPKPKPDPIRPLNVRQSAGPKDPSEMSMDEYAAHRKSQAN